MLAVVQNRDAARLMGIPVRWIVAGAFALSALLAGIAGALIAPLVNVHSEMGTVFGLPLPFWAASAKAFPGKYRAHLDTRRRGGRVRAPAM